MGSKGYGCELNSGYFADAVSYLRGEEAEVEQPRLPEKPGTYLVVTKTGAVTFSRFYPERDLKDYSGKFIRHEKGNFQTNRKVIYWMPLPEPPKEV